MDRIQALEVFVAVAETGSFAGGARLRGLSAPSVTRGVNALEARLGARLFTRTTRRVRLTDVGTAYLEDARHILMQLKAADRAASGAAAVPTGQLRITCPNEFGRLYVTPIVTAFLDTYPDVTADIVMLDRVVNIVEEGFDIAFRIGPLPSSGLTAVRVGRVRGVLCASPAYLATHGVPESIDELGRHTLVSVGTAGAAVDWRFGDDRQDVFRFTPRLTMNSVASAIAVARSGWGICRVLSYQIGPDLEDGTLELVLQQAEPAPLPVHLVHTEGRRAPAKVRAFLDFAKDRLRRVPVLSEAQNPIA